MSMLCSSLLLLFSSPEESCRAVLPSAHISTRTSQISKQMHEPTSQAPERAIERTGAGNKTIHSPARERQRRDPHAGAAAALHSLVRGVRVVIVGTRKVRFDVVVGGDGAQPSSFLRPILFQSGDKGW